MAAVTGGDEVPIIQAENLTSNVKSIYYSRTFLSIIGGVVAGIWGFTGLMGFVFYFVIMMVATIGLLAKSKFSVKAYFDSWSRISVEGVFGGLMSFVLFWTMIIYHIKEGLDTHGSDIGVHISWSARKDLTATNLLLTVFLVICKLFSIERFYGKLIFLFFSLTGKCVLVAYVLFISLRLHPNGQEIGGKKVWGSHK